jgi:hypothetical protein
MDKGRAAVRSSAIVIGIIFMLRVKGWGAEQAWRLRMLSS